MERGTLYPAWVYHKTKAPRIVHTAAEDEALGPDWSNTPKTFDEDAGEAETGGDGLHALSAKAAAAVAAEADLDTAKALLATEQANPNKDGGRPSVLKAIEKRIADLSA